MKTIGLAFDLFAERQTAPAREKKTFNFFGEVERLLRAPAIAGGKQQKGASPT